MRETQCQVGIKGLFFICDVPDVKIGESPGVAQKCDKNTICAPGFRCGHTHQEHNPFEQKYYDSFGSFCYPEHFCGMSSPEKSDVKI